jgi:excisionase family DNA binding protein
MPTTPRTSAYLPEDTEIGAAVAALPTMQEYLRRHADLDTVTLRAMDDEGETTLTVPRAALDLLAQILHLMSTGRGVSIVPSSAELTTQQAADMLNVSRPFLIGLLTAGEIPYRMVGTHRRILAEDLLSYRREDDRRRRAAADELTSLDQESGLY